MALSTGTQDKLRDALAAVDDFYTRRVEEVDRDVRNLQEYGAPLTAVGVQTTEAATTLTLSIIDDLLA